MDGLIFKNLGLSCIAWFFLCACTLSNAETNKPVPLNLLVNGVSTDYDIFSVFVLPNETVRVEVVGHIVKKLEVVSNDILGISGFQPELNFNAPDEPGRYAFKIIDAISSREISINVFVLLPYEHMLKGIVEGYRIDEYPHVLYRGLSTYSRPKGFVRVNESDLDVFVTPHFRIRQFLCKQKSGYPKFLVMQSKTLAMLEDFLKYVNVNGFKIDTFGVISAYRTPYYNRSIGNVPNSRHVYGDAMDIFIDRDKDGLLDDLDGDKKRSMNDVEVLYRLAVDFQEGSGGKYLGGIGRYQPKSQHGGFVHMDNRGYSARW